MTKRPRPSNTLEPHRDNFAAWCVCALLLLAVGLIYGQTLGHALLDYDDSGYVFANPHVSAGLTADGARWAFVDGPFGEWYPTTMLTHMLDCQLFGVAPWGHHLTNVLLHAASSLVLFLVLRQMTAELWPSAFVAAVFAVHPQHVESVAWIAERRDVLSGLFFMLTLAAWLGYLRHGRPLWRYLLAAVLLALGLMAKPMLVTVPPLLLLLDFWPLARVGRAKDIPPWTASLGRPSLARLIVEKLPLLALAAGCAWMTLRTHPTGATPQSWSTRIGNAAVSCVTYIAQFFYPIDLAVFYPPPAAGQPPWTVVGAVAILLVISAGVFIYRRNCPYGFVGWFWYLGMLMPVLGLVQVAVHVMADRYMYLPGIGLYIALAWGAFRWAGQIPLRRQALAAAAILAIVVLTGLAAEQATHWRNDETLWRHALISTPANAEAEVGLADTLAQKGQLDEAASLYFRAQQHATDSTPFVGLGNLLARAGNIDDATLQFRRGVEIDPKAFQAQINLGKALAEQRRFDEALEHLNRALQLNPDSADVHNGLAQLWRLQGNNDQARSESEAALRIDPDNVTAHNNLALALADQGKLDDAIAQFQAALAINSKNLLVRLNLARALAQSGRATAAAMQYRRVLELDAMNSAARQELDKLLSVEK